MEQTYTDYERFENRTWRIGYVPFDSKGVTVIPFYNRRTRNSNPNWRSQVANKTNATQPYSRLSSRMSERLRAKIVIRYKTAGTISTEVGLHAPVWDTISSPVLPDSVSPKAINQALGFFLEQVNSLNAPLKGGVVVGELRKTLRMIANPFVSSYRLLRAYKRNAEALKRKFLRTRPTKSGMREANRRLASLWLEYSFGLKPFLNDVQSGIVAYERFCSEKQGVKAIWGIGSDESLLASKNFESYYGVNIFTIGTYKSILKSSCKYAGEYGFSVGQEGPVGRAQQLCGFNPSEFVPTLWELLPFSWLADYFVNIGTIITATFTSTGNVLWYYRSDRAIRVQTWGARCDWARTKPMFPSDAYIAVDQQGSMVMETMTFARSIPPLGIPGIVFKFPGLTTQWANMLAVLTQARR